MGKLKHLLIAIGGLYALASGFTLLLIAGDFMGVPEQLGRPDMIPFNVRPYVLAAIAPGFFGLLYFLAVQEHAQSELQASDGHLGQSGGCRDATTRHGRE